MVQGHFGKILSGAQYHLKTVHLFSRADYLTVIPTVKLFQFFQSPVVNFNGSFRYPSQSPYPTARINGQL